MQSDENGLTMVVSFEKKTARKGNQMKFIEFNIKNFKGIKDATVSLEGGRIFTLVGLNEGGKTTLLEAIHSFSPDADTELVVGSAANVEEQKKQRVPRDQVGYFTGDVAVSAVLEFENGDINKFIEQAKAENNLDVQMESFEKKFTFKRMTRFENGNYKGSYYLCSLAYKIKSGQEEDYRRPNSDEKAILKIILENMFPRIAYFPTFVFEFPSKIYLTEGKGSKANDYYRKLFQDILDYDNNGLRIDQNIVSRIRSSEAKLPWGEFNTWLNDLGEKPKINHVIAKAGQAVTHVVFDRWKKVFKEGADGREIVVSWDVEQGNKDKDANGNEIPATEHDLYVDIKIKRGTEEFPIEDCSLGFRWFFTFLLFTQFRVARNDGHPVIFLFDEPASNLHAIAQQKLVESFPKIATIPHIFIYTTHSHYMIEPKWLEQTYIVQNSEMDTGKKLISGAISKDKKIGIKAINYRKFVNSKKSSVSYFQPIMDRLEVAPSKFDYDKRGVILEGKSDYFIFRYLSEVHFKKKINFFPGVGATTLDPLISLQKGWGLPVLVLLDSDKAGKRAKKTYIDKYFLKNNEVICLDDLVAGLVAIESLLEPQDRDTIKTALSVTHNPNKKNICQFFQENLAAGNKIKLSEEMTEKSEKLLEAIEKLIKEQIQD